MRIIADFHIHSKYSRATSRDMDLEHISQAAGEKGITVVGTGDFTHPEWFNELKNKLEPAGPGLFRLKNLLTKTATHDNGTRFILTTEISCIYSKKGRVRKIHILIFAPDFQTIEKINVQLGWIGNLKSDGRPILGLDVKELAKIVLNISQDCLIVPGHCLTPWFGIFGSMSGFDSIEECFEDYSKYVYAMETGLSADPKMLWRIPDGRRITLISNSDAHSSAKLGREVNVFDTEMSYTAIRDAIVKKDLSKFLFTIEFFPEEGKYHYDGHRLCQIRTSPEETKKIKGICPKCGRSLTVGVLSRVDELADRKVGFVLPGAIPYKSLVPLKEIIAEAVGVQPKTKTVAEYYQKLIRQFSNEFNVLLNVPLEELNKSTLPEIKEGIRRVREGELIIEPGYDGEFGKVRIFHEAEKKEEQNRLF